MQHSRFGEQLIAYVLDQVARGASVELTCHAAGIPVQTYYGWRAKYAGLGPAEIRRLREVEAQSAHQRRPAQPPIAAPPRGTALVPSGPRAAPVPLTPPVAVSRYRQPANGRRQSAITLRAHPAPEPDAGLWAKVIRASRARALLILCFVAGLAGGFAMGLAPIETEGHIQQAVPVNMSLRVDNYGVLSSTMDKGWGQLESWGRWMEGGNASIRLAFDGPAADAVELMLDARVRLAEGHPEQVLIVRFNDEQLGRWRLPKEDGQVHRRFIVPRDAFNRDTAAQLTFGFEGQAPLSPVFGLEAVSLRDVKYLHSYRGYVDSCRGGKVVGWAVAETLAVTVAASVDGKPLPVVQTNVERPDLVAIGLPADAGFELRLEEPVAAGRAIDVRFANGRPLSGSPCTP